MQQPYIGEVPTNHTQFLGFAAARVAAKAKEAPVLPGASPSDHLSIVRKTSPAALAGGLTRLHDLAVAIRILADFSLIAVTHLPLALFFFLALALFVVLLSRLRGLLLRVLLWVIHLKTPKWG